MASSTKAGLWYKIASLNVNGLNDVSKQIKLVTYLNEKSVNIAMIQEHNVKSLDKLEYILKYYTVILNKSILFKGGIIILIEKNASYSGKNISAPNITYMFKFNILYSRLITAYIMFVWIHI